MDRPFRPAAAACLGLAFALATALAGPALAGADGCPEGMRLQPGGRFTLADGSEVAEVEALCLDESEVTAAAYAACVRRGGCSDSGLRCGRAATYGNPTKAGHPVNCVAWTDADQFCRASGKRLPTEAEWEWAARGRLRALAYPWGAAPPADRACWDGPGSSLGKGARNETCAAGAFPAGDSPDGLHDLGGNVREWTASRIGRDRVVRGGSWGDSLPDFLAAGFRGMNKADERFEITGFRCAAAPGGGVEPALGAREPPPPATPTPPARSAARVEPPAARPAVKAAARPAPPPSAAGEAEEGTIVAPLEADLPPPVLPAARPPPPAKVARPEPPRPSPAAPPAPRSGPRLQVDIGDIKIERLSGTP